MKGQRVAGSQVRNLFAVPGDCTLRGDYTRCRADYTVDQDYDLYSDAEHALWRRLYRRQAELLGRYAAPEFVAGIEALDMAKAIPRLGHANDVLRRATGWQLVGVPGLIPNDVFFSHLASCRFPVSVWLRKPEEMDYLVEPDIFHDFFGHVPLLSNPIFADYMRVYGEQGTVALEVDAVGVLSRLYWYMVEFGLIRTGQGLRAFGSGILSSAGEMVYCIDSTRPHRVAFDPLRIMRTEYRIDSYQQTYFVLDSFEELFVETRRDLRAVFRQAKEAPTMPPTQVEPTDKVIHRGQWK